MSFEVNASADKPIYNPAFVIKNWYSLYGHGIREADRCLIQ